jgi:hypothetical protein
MRISRSVLMGGSLPALVLWIASAPSWAETRGYAISFFHMATYAQQGNCPHGGNGATTEIHLKILMDQGYTREQALKTIIGHDRKIDFDRRGQLYGKVVDIGDFPTSVPDDHIETVQGAGSGHYAYGFNLVGTPTPYSFEDPETHELVQNQLWRAYGCFSTYEYNNLSIPPYSEGITWDTAMDSMPAWLLSISGRDLSQDGDVTVTFDRSLDILMRDRNGKVLEGSSYTIDPDRRNHSVFHGHIKDHVLTIEPGKFFMQGESQFIAVIRFTNTHLRLKLGSDGTVRGIIGGYEPWLDYWYFCAIRGEDDSEIDIPGAYYALRRLADAAPDASGQNTAISAAYYLEAVPVYVLDRSGSVVGIPHMNGAELSAANPY